MVYSLSNIITWGKYRWDKYTLAQLIQNNPRYIRWQLTHNKWFEIDQLAIEALEARIEELDKRFPTNDNGDATHDWTWEKAITYG